MNFTIVKNLNGKKHSAQGCYVSEEAAKRGVSMVANLYGPEWSFSIDLFKNHFPSKEKEIVLTEEAKIKITKMLRKNAGKR